MKTTHLIAAVVAAALPLAVVVAEAHTLIDLAEIKALSQGELAERLHLEKSTISRLVAPVNCSRLD